MQKVLLPFVAASVVCVAQAMTPEEACEQLFSVLENQAIVLQGVKDNTSAAEAVKPLNDCMTKQAELFGVDENALWLHIDNSEGVKQKFVVLLQELAAEYSRLESAKFFDCAELRKLVYTQLLSEG